MCEVPDSDVEACVPEFVLVLMLDDDTDVPPFGALLDCETLALTDDCVAPGDSARRPRRRHPVRPRSS